MKAPVDAASESSTPLEEGAGIAVGSRLPALLLVDDDPDMRALMALMLREESRVIDEAGDGEAAWRVLRGHPLPSIVVTDLLMPVMSGMELIRSLRADPLTADIPIVVVSGSVDSQHALEVSGLATAMLDKASILENLVATVRSVMVEGALTRPSDGAAPLT